MLGDQFVANHPFAFFIQTNGTVLFEGVVVDPKPTVSAAPGDTKGDPGVVGDDYYYDY